MIEKTGEVFSVAGLNKPLAASSIMSTVYENFGYMLTRYSLGAGAATSPERYDHPCLYFADKGTVVIDYRDATAHLQNIVIPQGYCILRPAGKLWGFHSDEDTVFSELMILRTSVLHPWIRAEKIYDPSEFISFRQNGVDRRMIVNDINMKLSLFSADKGVTIDRESETGDLMVRCLYGSGTIFTKNKQQKITVGDTIFIPRKQGYTIKAEERLKFTEMFIL